METALAAHEKGIACIPVVAGTKVPAVAWKRWQGELPPVALLKEWFRTRCNIAVVCTGMVLFDCDIAEIAELVLRECGDTPHKVRTPRGGVHLGYRQRKGVALTNRVRIKGRPIDVRTDGGIALIPPSAVGGVPYEWLGAGLNRISDLPVARVGWLRERKKRSLKRVMRNTSIGIPATGTMPLTPMPMIGTGDTPRLLERGRRYVDCFERAVSGAGGHTTTFLSALKIVRFVRSLGGDEAATWELLRYYNATKCDPEWREEPELTHKLKEAQKEA